MRLRPQLNTSLLEQRFEQNFAENGELGAAVSIWKEGSEVLSLVGGFMDGAGTQPWRPDTLAQVWSCTKGFAAVAFLHALENVEVSLDRAVSHFWPEFGANGKGGITCRQVLAHRAGLAALDSPVPEARDNEEVIAALERQEPLWEPDSAHGYHARTFGYLLDGMLGKLIPGETIGAWWRTHFALPFELDIHIGLPTELHRRVAQLQPARGPRFASPEAAVFNSEISRSGSLPQRAMSSPRGLMSVQTMNTPAGRSAALPSFSGVATARALGKFYAMLADPDLRPALLPEEWFDQLTRRFSNGHDLVLQMPTAFSAGLMLDPIDSAGNKLRRLFGPALNAFGHPGAGGSHAFADPSHGFAFAYVMNQMELGVLPNLKSLRLVDALYDNL